MEKKLGEKQDLGHDIDEKEETIFDLYMLLIGYAIIIVFGLWFHKFFYNTIPENIFKLSLLLLTAFPIIMYTSYILYEIYSVRAGATYNQLLEEANLELEKEEKIAEIIPVILFGIGIVYANIQKNAPNKMHILKIVAPYLIFSLLFGTVFPNIISYLVFDHHDLKRVLIASDFDFVFVSMAFGLMITSLLTPFFLIYK